MIYLLDAERSEPDEAMMSMMDDLHLSNPGKNFNCTNVYIFNQL